MTRITFVEFNGREQVVTVEPGCSLMNSAKDNCVPGIDADWEFVEGIQASSRLSCQITVTPELDGLVVRLPESQR